MHRPIYTWPFLLAYRIVIFPFKIIKYFFLFFVYIFKFLFGNKKKNTINETKNTNKSKKIDIKKLEQLEEERIKNLKKERIEQEKIAKAEKLKAEKLAKKREIQAKKLELKQEKLEKKRKAREEMLEKKKKIQEERNLKKQQIRAEQEAKRKQLQEEKLAKKKEVYEEKLRIERDKKEKKEAEMIRKTEEKNLKKKEKKEALERKKKEKQERLESRKKKKNKDEYVNEDVVIEKESFNDKLSNLSEKFLKLPSKIKQYIKDRYDNSTFVKNRRNKLDMDRQALLVSFNSDDEVKSDVKILFEYVVKDAEGKMVKGYFNAFSKVEVLSYLMSEGYEVYSVRTSKWIQLMHSNVSTNKKKIKPKDLIFFSTQLSTYIKAGIPLVDALKILVRQFKDKKYKKIFNSIIYDLTTGDNFSESMTKQGDAFPKIFINMVKASEMTGELPESLDEMADYFTETEKTRKAMITAMMYPSIIFVFAIAASAFIMMYVVPQFYEIYAAMDDAEIPGITIFVMNLSKFLKNYALFILFGLIVFIALFIYLYKKVKFFKTIIQWILMHMPVFGNVIIYNEVTMFTKTFASLLKHNVFITDSMDILNKMTNNQVYKMLILDTITNLAKGEKISAAFENNWAFPLPAYEMLVTGEKTGQLAEMMERVADYYQDLHSNAVTRIKTFVEPVMIVFLTVIVGVIVLAIVIPMFNMYSTLG